MPTRAGLYAGVSTDEEAAMSQQTTPCWLTSPRWLDGDLPD